MECLLYLGVTNVRQWLPLYKKVLVVRPQTLGALYLNGRILGHFLGASSLKNEKYHFFQHILLKKLTNLGASDLTSKMNRFLIDFSKPSYFTTNT